MPRLRSVLLFFLPVMLVTALVLCEVYLFTENDPLASLDNRFESIKLAVQLNSSLVTTFIGIATAVIGAVAYYLRTRVNEFNPIPGWSVACLVSCLLSAFFSIYFGHLVLSTMRNQLIHDAFDGASWVMRWTERLQFASLILALGWFGLLVVERETSRRAKPGKEPEQAVVTEPSPKTAESSSKRPRGSSRVR